MMAFAVTVGLVLRFYLRWRHPRQVEQYQRVGRSLSWPYFAAGVVFFLALAIGLARQHHRRLSLFLIFAGAATLCAHSPSVFIRERSTEYGLRHLLIAMTVAAILAALCHWYGMAMAVVLRTGVRAPAGSRDSLFAAGVVQADRREAS